MKNDTKPQAENEATLKCPFCGHDRFQRHERGVFVVDKDGENAGPFVAFRVDEVAVLCLKCQVASLQSELVK